MTIFTPRMRLALAHGLFAAVFASGCAAPVRAAVSMPPVPAPPPEPSYDTIGEYPTNERVACAKGTELVYVLSRDGALHAFHPDEVRFEKIGTLSCPGTSGARPHSMAVDRTGRAWVGYDNGRVVHASITDARCTASDLSMDLEELGERTTFGMGFAPTPKGGIGGETLFISRGGERDVVADAPGRGVLSRVDDGRTVSVAGHYPSSILASRAELSSRADGRLFAFFARDPAVLAEIDPESADVRWQRPLESVRFSHEGASSWAFAAVGSEFFFFWANDETGSKVTRLRADGVLEPVAHAGLTIVGAGASTCAVNRPTRAPLALPDPPPSEAPSSAAKEPMAKASASKAAPPKASASKASPPKAAPVKVVPAKTAPTPPSPPPAKRGRGWRDLGRWLLN